MRPTAMAPAVIVTLRESTVALLVTQRRNEDETLDTVTARLARAALPAPAEKAPLPAVDAQQRQSGATGKYTLTFLGETLGADTLGALFAEVVDSLVEVDPESVERLAAMRSRKRGLRRAREGRDPSGTARSAHARDALGLVGQRQHRNRRP